MDWTVFCAEMTTCLYQCGCIAKRLKGKVTREDKEPEEYQLSTAVSNVDRLCQEIMLLKGLHMLPEIEVCSEEIADVPPDVKELFDRNSNRYVLVIDPVDGTDCYLEGGNQYAHMLGILDQESRRMTCGLVYFPELSSLYYAIRGIGSFVVKGLFGEARKLEPTEPPRSYGRIKRLTEQDYAAFKKAGFFLDMTDNGSAAYAHIRVAEGSLGAMVARHFHGYDTAITSVIIEEVGGAVLGEDGNMIRYEKTMPRRPLVISSVSPEVSVALYQALHKQ
ncbi:MAG: inositol monophosphatase family protein [Dehalococcoidia bacterium]